MVLIAPVNIFTKKVVNMSNSNIVPASIESNLSSPFDAIRRYNASGNEYWLARELMKMLGYVKWERFENPIQQAIENLELNQDNVSSNIFPLEGSKVTKSGGGDYKLSRYGCYMVALCCEGRKPEVAQAKRYFAVKARQAEVVIPAQNDRIRELELEVRALELRSKENDRQDFRLSAYGLSTTLLLDGKSDSVVEVDRPILEVIDQQSGVKFSGQTTKQLADYLNKNGGRNFKSGAELERELTKLGRADLVDTVPRKALQPFVSKENLSEACKLLVNNRQQLLL